MTKPKVKPEDYIYEAAEYWRLVESIKALYSKDPEAAHGNEDELIERYIRDASWQYNDPRAEALIALLDHERVRWYA